MVLLATSPTPLAKLSHLIKATTHTPTPPDVTAMPVPLNLVPTPTVAKTAG